MPAKTELEEVKKVVNTQTIQSAMTHRQSAFSSWMQTKINKFILILASWLTIQSVKWGLHNIKRVEYRHRMLWTFFMKFFFILFWFRKFIELCELTLVIILLYVLLCMYKKHFFSEMCRLPSLDSSFSYLFSFIKKSILKSMKSFMDKSLVIVVLLWLWKNP